MGVYRVEYAKSARAACQGPPCKKAGVKIGKGEMRFGTWVEIPGQPRGSFKWRHFGCVTDKVIKNMQTEYKKVEDELDGFEEMSSEDGKKIKDAIARGHLLDEDKTPDEREPKQVPESTEDESKKPEKATKRKTAAKKEADSDSAASEEPVTKKSKAAPKKVAAKKPTPKKTVASRKRKGNASESEEESEEAELTELSESSEEAVETEEEEDVKPKKKSKKATPKKAPVPKKTTPKRAAAPKTEKSKTVESDESESLEDDDYSE